MLIMRAPVSIARFAPSLLTLNPSRVQALLIVNDVISDI
jgi:hypothetical protein